MDISGHYGEIPIPLTSTYVTRAPPPPPLHPFLHKTENQSPTNLTPNNKKLVEVGHAHPKVVKYKECLKNHAAAMGGNATDGCGEFMPGGEEGTLEAFKCSACNCHRNFHRKAVQGEIAYSFGYVHRPHPPALIMPLGAIPTTTSESEEMEDAGYVGGVSGGNIPPLMVKKRRFRTKFTQEQKEKMLDFADKFGWKLPRQEEGLVQSFCQEIGVKRRVLKVWMHNNKHSLGKIKGYHS